MTKTQTKNKTAVTVDFFEKRTLFRLSVFPACHHLRYQPGIKKRIFEFFSYFETFK